jgi:hypothetical protein
MRDFIRRKIGSPDFLAKGRLTPISNNIFLFSNAIAQAIKADFEVATEPKTRSGFWWKTSTYTFIPKLLMMAAALGLFGNWLKKWISRATEYDKTNYILMPIGYDSANDKAIYMRIPQDETSRLLGAIFWKMIDTPFNKQRLELDIRDIMSLWAGQLPTITPTIEIPISIVDFLKGNNPYDAFRQRNVLTDQQMQAGGWYAWKPFLMWQIEQLGGNIFMKFNTGQPSMRTSIGEKILNLPILSNIIGRLIKISDYGLTEKLRQVKEEVQTKKAQENLRENRIITDYVEKSLGKSAEEIHQLGRNAVKEILGHEPQNTDELTEARTIVKKVRIGAIRGKYDTRIISLINSTSNDEKIALLKTFKDEMGKDEFNKLLRTVIDEKIVSVDVLKKMNSL